MKDMGCQPGKFFVCSHKISSKVQPTGQTRKGDEYQGADLQNCPRKRKYNVMVMILSVKIYFNKY